MNNTSNNKTANKPTKNKDKDKLRVIVGEIGRDSKTGILGRGYSSDNGKTFHVTDTMYGRLYDPNDIEGIWNGGTADKVKKEVDSATAEIPAAVSAANSAVSAAESAVAASRVNSDAIAAQSEAISEAKSAMDSATAEIQQTAANAASDAAKIRADVARVQSEVDTAKAANSASVDALKSDINTAKQDLANVHGSLTKAQSAVEQNQKLINDSVAKISNDIAQDRKDLATAQQNNADLAKQLGDYSKQAEAQGKTIKSIQDKQDSFTATLADVQGNVSQVSDKVDGLSASLKDTQGNVATVKAQTDQLSATLTDHAKSIATLTASAKGLSSTLEDADGRLSKVEQTAQTSSSTLSDVQGDLSQVKQQADGLVSTLKDAQGSITQIQQKADGTLAQLKSAQGDIASLQTDVTGIKATLVSHEGDIHTLQADSKSLHDSMQDAQGDISTLKKTSTDVTSELKDHAGRLSKVEQTASTLTNEFSDEQGHLNRVEQTAQGTQQTVANQQGQINTIKTDAAGIHETITGQGNQIANINVTLNGLNTKYEGVSGDLGKLKDQVTTNSTQITQNKKEIDLKANQDTVDNLTGEVSQTKAQLKVQADQISSKVSSTDFKMLDDKFNDMKIGGRNLVAGTGQDTVIDDTANTGTQGWCFWVFNLTQQPKVGDQLTVSAEGTLTGKGNLGTYDVILYNSTTITNPRSNSKRLSSGKRASATLQVNNLDGNGDTVLLIYAGNISDTEGKKNTVHHLKVEFGNLATDWTPAPEDLTTAIQKNSTAIDQTNKQISLKADQTEVDKIKNTATQNSSRLDVMAGQISSKVTSTDVNNIVDSKGYATTSTVQSLITQKAGTINESITNLTSKVNSNNGGGINLLKATDFSNTDLTKLKDVWGPNFTLRDGKAMQLDQLKGNGDLDATQFLPVEPDTDYTLSFEAYYDTVASGGSYNNIYTFIVEYKDQNNTTPHYLDHMRVVANTADRSKNTQTIHTQKDCHYVQVFFRASAKTLFSFWRPKLERGSVATPWSPAPSDLATVTQLQSVTASIDGLQSTVANKADKSQITQLSNLVQSKVSTSDFTSKVSQLSNDINARVTKGDLLSQINLEAGQALIQSKKIFLDADTVAFSGKAFIPSAAITSLDADKITSGYIKVPMSDGNGNSVQVSNNGVDILSNNKESKLFNANRGIASVHIDAAGMGFGATTNGAYEQLGALSVLLDDSDGISKGTDNLNGIGFVVETQQQYGSPYGGDFFSLARSIKGPPSYYNGFLYEASGSGKHEIGSHFFDPVYFHPFGADNYIKSTWVSWTGWDNNERYPALVQAGPMEGGIAFPKSGRVTLFDASGRYFTPTQWGGAYTDFQHVGPGNAYHDPSQAI